MEKTNNIWIGCYRLTLMREVAVSMITLTANAITTLTGLATIIRSLRHEFWWDETIYVFISQAYTKPSDAFIRATDSALYYHKCDLQPPMFVVIIFLYKCLLMVSEWFIIKKKSWCYLELSVFILHSSYRKGYLIWIKATLFNFNVTIFT